MSKEMTTEWNFITPIKTICGILGVMQDGIAQYITLGRWKIRIDN